MIARSLFAALLAILLAGARPVMADDRDDASAAANEILAALDQQAYELIWDKLVSEFLKTKSDKDSFVSTVAIGRANLGKLRESRLTEVVFAESDAKSGYQGRIYTVKFANAYANGKYLERIVVVKEGDGQYRLAGLWAIATTQEQ